MERVRACVACLATDVRLQSMTDKGLLKAYQQLNGRQNADEMPQQLCWECAALVYKFIMFRRKCKRAYLLLQDVFCTHQEITIEELRKLDRFHHGLSSALVTCKTKVYTCELKDDTAADGSTYDVAEASTSDVEGAFFKYEVPLDHIKCETKVKTEPDFVIETAFLRSEDRDSTSSAGEEEATPSKHTAIRNVYRKRAKSTDADPKKFNATEIILTQEKASEIFMRRKEISAFKKARYKCKKCFRSFKDKQGYSSHCLKHDSMAGGFACDICKGTFSTKSAIEVHINFQHMRQYSCNICSKVSNTRLTAKKHFLAHQKKGPTLADLRVKKEQSKIDLPESAVMEVLLSQEQMMEVVRVRQDSEAYKTSNFKCTLCYKGFLDKKTYSNHMLLHDKVSGEFECDMCRLLYRTRRLLYKHITSNHMRQYICRRCPYVCYSRSSARGHFKWHEGVIFTCKICGAVCRTLSGHLSHMRIKHVSQHACAECGESFLNPPGLARHRRLMHALKQDGPISSGDGPYCEECKVHFATTEAWTRHILISLKHENLKSTISNGCRFCGRTFGSADLLKQHRRAAHPPRVERPRKPLPPRPCSQCGERFATATKYRAHFKAQHPDQTLVPVPQISTHICEVCGKGFQFNAALLIHMTTHSDARPHCCSECGKGFKLASARDRHQRLHTGARPYECNVCGKTFATSTGRNTHSRSVHKTEPEDLGRRGARGSWQHLSSAADTDQS